MYDEHIDILNNDQNTELVNFKKENNHFADINFSSKVVKNVQALLLHNIFFHVDLFSIQAYG